MASLFSHPAFPIAIVISNISNKFSLRLLVLCIVLTVLPDADVIAFRLDIPYESQWGHRGFTHSVTFAFLLAVVSRLFSKQLQSTKRVVFLATFSSTLSHSFFDALTNGGLGVAFFWPMTEKRFFLPIRPVQVSPLGIKGFFTIYGIKVLFSEIIFIWLPCLLLSLGVRKRSTRQG